MKTKSKFYYLLLIITTLTLALSCSQNNSMSQSVTISVNNSASRTITPSEVQPISEYEFILTSKTNATQTYTQKVKTSSVTFDNVIIDNYTVTVNGYNAANALTQTGSGELSLTIKGTNSVSIQMAIIKTGDNLTGSIELPVDWSQVITLPTIANAFAGTGLKFELMVKEKDLPEIDFVSKATQVVIDNETHTTTLTFDNLPIGQGQLVYLNIYNNATGQLLARNFFTSTANISSGQISKPDKNDSTSGTIMPNVIVTANNISNIKWDYNATSKDTAIDLTWNNPASNNKNLAKIVNVTYYSTQADKKTITLTYTDETTLTGTTTLTELVAGTYYTVEFDCIYFNDLYSSTKKLPYKLTPYIYVESLTLNESNVPTTAITNNDSFVVTATVSPENAVEKAVNWTSTKPEVVNFSNGVFVAHKPGVAQLTATTSGNTKAGTPLTQTIAKPIQVILASPSILAEVKDSTIVLSWNAVEYAENYELYEIKDNGVATKLETLTTTTFTKTNIVAGSAYQYYVVATAPTLNEGTFKADSANSNTTEAVTPVKPNITIIEPTLDASFAINFTTTSADRLITPENTMLTINVGEITGAQTYTWYINGTQIKTGDWTAANFVEITKATTGIYTDTSSSYNTLMLKVTGTNGNTYSATTSFEVIAVMDTGVKVYINGLQDGAKYIPTTNNTVELSYDVLPGDASNQNVTFTSSNQDVATVDSTGLVTIKTFGDVNITVTPAHGTATVVPLKFYTPTYSTPLDILNDVNSILRTHIVAANTKSNGDWWGYNSYTYNTTGINIDSSNSTAQSNGSIKLTDYKETVTGKGELTLNTTTAIKTWANGLTMGYMYDDPLQTIGYSDTGDLQVTLPYEQGVVTIHYSNINVYDANRAGSYTITFTPINIGGKDYHLMGDGPIVDSAAVTRLFN